MVGELAGAALAALLALAPDDSLADRVRRLADGYLAAWLERHPDDATVDGAAGADHGRLTDNTRPALERWHAREDAWLAELRAIDPAPLAGRPEWTAYGVMRASLEGSAATRVCRFELWGVAQTHTGWLDRLTSVAGAQPVGTDSLRALALARWRAMPAFIAAEAENQREGLRRGYSAPRSNVRLVLRQLDAVLATPLDSSPFLDPSRRDPDPAFRAAMRDLVRRELLPAARRYRAFLASDYLPRARTSLAVAAHPDGAACYRGSIRAATGLDLAPDSIHRLGLATVAALEADMRAIARRAFGADEPGPLLDRLRADPRHGFRSRQEIVTHAMGAVERARSAMPRWFGRVPRADVVVEPYPAFRERESVGEWSPPAEDGSRPGVYLVSAWDAPRKSRVDLAPLAFHETIPGHHLQGAIAIERGDAIPAIARAFWSPGFGEGWAEYAEQLADEMGLYASDAERLGALADVTLSATLLVVDTGIHAYGWTREQGIAYIRAHTRVPRSRAEVPVDRYPVWPAQGLSYALGRLEIRRLRAEAERALGPRFDVRAFHDAVLEDGVIPLPMLREKMERWRGAPAAQPPDAPVRAAIARLFDAMRAGDSATVRAVFHPSALLATALTRGGGAAQVDSLEQFIRAVGTPHAEVWDERLGAVTVQMDGPLATAWAEYTFYAGDRLSHCGVNAFQLVRLGAADWKIIALTDTRRREGCPARGR